MRRLNAVLNKSSGLLSDKELDAAIKVRAGNNSRHRLHLTMCARDCLVAFQEVAGSMGGLLHVAWRGGPDTMGVDFGQFFEWFRQVIYHA